MIDSEKKIHITAGGPNKAILYAGNYYYTISDAGEPEGNNY